MPGQAGYQGLKGTKGETGDVGYPGLEGLEGAPGYPGDVGYSGVKGSRGPPGLTGTKGLAGPRGVIGPVGIVGPPGFRGMPGADGRSGLPGLQGLPGKKGFMGSSGLEGLPGPNGLPGIAGLPGKNAVLPPAPKPKGNFFAVHSQTTEAPLCPDNTLPMWEGYSLLHIYGNGHAHGCRPDLTTTPTFMATVVGNRVSPHFGRNAAVASLVLAKCLYERPRVSGAPRLLSFEVGHAGSAVSEASSAGLTAHCTPFG